MSIESRSNQYGTVFGNWQIKELLGHGSGGKTAVFRLSRNDSFEESCALKVINLIEEKGCLDDFPEDRQKEYREGLKDCEVRAITEVKLMAELSGNTNVVGYLDHEFVSWSDASGFGCDLLIRMELLTDLRSIIRRGRIFDESEILHLGRDICTALVLCHDSGILHRDIKPENIMVNKKGHYKLGDFGISRLLDVSASSTATTNIGTPEYAAPEQFFGGHDMRVDIYSLGLVLYELCNQNRLPFASSSYVRQADTLKRQQGAPFPMPAGISSGLWSVIQKACAHKPSERYATAQQFLDALEALSGYATQPPTPKPPICDFPPAPEEDLTDPLGKTEPLSGYKTQPAAPKPHIGDFPTAPTEVLTDPLGKTEPLSGYETQPAAPKPHIGDSPTAPKEGNPDQAGETEPLGGYGTPRPTPKPPTPPAPGNPQKRKFILFALTAGTMVCLIYVVLFLYLNRHKHTWQPATCEAPKTCTECGIAEGDPLEHQWLNATCTQPETCFMCKETRGLAKEHQWQPALCQTPETCSLCMQTRGEPLGHMWAAATRVAPKTCTVCAASEGTTAAIPLSTCHVLANSDEVGKGTDVALGSWRDCFNVNRVQAVKFWVMYKKGWANTEYIDFSLDGMYETLVGTASLKEKSSDGCEASIYIYADGILIHEQHNINIYAEPTEFSISVKDAKVLTVKCITFSPESTHCIFDAFLSKSAVEN